MQQWFYKFMIRLSQRWGSWIFVLLARGIATGYYLFFPQRVLIGARFYRALFPDQSGLFHLRCTFKQFQNFTTVFFDRYQLRQKGTLTYDFDGWQHLGRAMAEKSGGILLMSHMGNWEVAAHLLKQDAPDLSLLLYMGRKQKEAIEGLQKKSLIRHGITIVVVDQETASPFDLVGSMRHLDSGGFIAMTGDRLWRKDQRSLTVRFMGHPVQLPQTPHLLALVAKVPLYVFFASQPKKDQFYFYMAPPYWVQADQRAKRLQALSQSAQHYADLLQSHLRKHPFEWYHFESFLGKQVRSNLD
jgi:predicted LPLAT superfamily acyltransferase